jgi:Icc-related predicted phosphoesterase
MIKIKPRLFVCGHIHIPGEIDFKKIKVINPGPFKVINF